MIKTGISSKKYHQRWRQHRAIRCLYTVDTVGTVDMVYTVDTVSSTDPAHPLHKFATQKK